MKYNPSLKNHSQSLRKNMTREERHLWYDFLKTIPYSVNRQKVIGNYIVDFYCAAAKVAVELDGSQHYEEEGREKDIERDRDLNNIGIKVLRFSNYEINRNFNEVCEEILRVIRENVQPHPSATQTPSP